MSAENKPLTDFAQRLLKKRLKVVEVFVALAIVIIWAMFLLDRFAGLDLRGDRVPRDHTMPLAMPVVVTIVAIAIGGLWYWRDYTVIHRGIPVTAEVVKIHGIAVDAFQEITLRYTMDGNGWEGLRTDEERFDAFDRVASRIDGGSLRRYKAPPALYPRGRYLVKDPTLAQMATTPRVLTGSMLRHIVWRNAGKFLVLAVVFWVLALAAIVAELMGFKLRVRSYGFARVLEGRTALIMAAVVTAIVLAICVPLVLRAMRLSKAGVQVLGSIRRKLGVTLRSFETVLISYTFNNQAHTIKAPLGERDDAVGTQVQLIVDPQAPQRAMLREHVFPPGYDINA